jgi:hypothetical protein
MAVGRGKSKFKDPSLGASKLGGSSRGGGDLGGSHLGEYRLSRPRRDEGGAGRSLLMVMVSLIIAFGVLEVGTRMFAGGSFEVRNYVAEKLSLLRSAYPSVYDPLLGYIPKPSYSGSENAWGTQVTIDDRGLRTNGAGPVGDSASVLAVGDSFTFGDEVSDHESWPAQVSTLLGADVANAGVFGYGLDQSVLRAERLAPQLKPWAIVVSFIYGDVRRTQLIQRTGVEKPYFEVVDGALALRNVPPSEFRPRIEQIGLARTTLGYSYLVDFAMRRAGLTGWWYGGGFPQVQVHDDGPVVACLLMRRLKALEAESGAKVLVVAQYLTRNFLEPSSPKSVEELAGTRQLLDCARDNGLQTIDTHDRLRGLFDKDPSGFISTLFLQSHMSAEGNAIVAEMVADGLAEMMGQ